MGDPVFVIHGIGARSREAFATMVSRLAANAGRFEGRPVFWGDLGARTDMIDCTVPGARGLDEIREGEPTAPGQAASLAEFLAIGDVDEIRDPDLPPPVLVDAALVALRAEPYAEIRERSNAAEIEEALRWEWPHTRWLAGVKDPSLLAAVGAALTAPLTDRATPPLADDETLFSGEELRDGGVGEIEARGRDIGRFIRRRLAELDRVVGAAFGAAGSRLNSHLRSAMLPGMTQYVGDILVYQRHRAQIHDRVRQVLVEVDSELGLSPERPVDILAHSLGGVIAVDMATADEPLWIRNLVTFGSQSAFFHICDPRGGRLQPFEGTGKVRLPASLGGWTNLWEPLDMLAFLAASVFELHDGSAPTDRYVPHLASSGLWSHSAYWQLPSVGDAIAGAMGIRR